MSLFHFFVIFFKVIVFHTQITLLCLHLLVINDRVAYQESLYTLIFSWSSLRFSVLLIWLFTVMPILHYYHAYWLAIPLWTFAPLQNLLQILNKFVLLLYNLLISDFQIKKSKHNVGHLCVILCYLLKQIGKSPMFIQVCF